MTLYDIIALPYFGPIFIFFVVLLGYGVTAAHALIDGPKVYIIEEDGAEVIPRNAYNNRKGVYIKKDVGTQSWIGVLAQETWEYKHKWRWLQLPAVIEGLTRHMELMGHAVEIAAAAHLDLRNIETYERREAASLLTYPIFITYDEQELRNALRVRRPDAMKWVLENEAWLRAHRRMLDV